ncbi:molybdenum cofactor guanylyltransferase [Jatrophihabitans endophyticus]|uniref:molybdenum cofactor guanylyltransferase n=1 Tax=Jatrophihabitans endophyticus TaxID=1206085 RepID=UPI0026F0A4E0|nr:NTP transferase domain-containing protein [Jatrophihabitans endophyticus]
MYDAIVPAGGRARRLGGVDKLGMHVAGTPLLDHVLAAVAGARTVVCAGPARATARPVVWCREDPPGAGPVAAIAAALPATSADTVLVLAADLPFVAPAVPALLSALTPGADVSVLVDATGQVNHLVAAWRRPALTDALAALGDPTDAPMRVLAAGRRLVTVADTAGWGRDCDTWDDLEAARTAYERAAT